ncbi:IS21 family transposase, partial [Roseateles sp. BYS78W]
NGAPFTELPVAFKKLQTELLKKPGGDREMVEVLALVLHHEEQSVLAAVELALEVGVPTKMYVINVLHRLLDGKADPPPVDAPQALRLTTEPQANVTRYDDLRNERKVRHA